MVIGTDYFAVFNHDPNTSTTRSATVVDSVQQSITSEPLSSEALLAAGQTDAPLEQRALHWHFRLNPQLRDFLE
jgi:hypothetical protein